MDANIIALVVALIGIAGGIWAQIVQFKKDAQRIDAVNGTSSDIRGNVYEIKPKIYSIDENTKTMKDDITRSILPQMGTLNYIQNGMMELLDAKRVDEVIKQKVSNTIDNPVYIQNAIGLVYERNATLETQNAELKNENMLLKLENQQLKLETEKIKEELKKYRTERDNRGLSR